MYGKDRLPRVAAQRQRGACVLRVCFGIDDDLYTRDHSCSSLAGCPSLTIEPNPRPLRTAPLATLKQHGVGGCGENAHAATLCPSFYKAEPIQNPNIWDRLMAHRALSFHPPHHRNEPATIWRPT